MSRISRQIFTRGWGFRRVSHLWGDLFFVWFINSLYMNPEKKRGRTFNVFVVPFHKGSQHTI